MPLVDGLHNHPNIVMTDAKYTSKTATADFVFIVNLATAPIHSSMDTTAQIDNTICLHGENCRDFQLYHDVEKSLCNQYIAATPSTLLHKVQDHILGLRQVNILHMLTHLNETYNKITQ